MPSAIITGAGSGIGRAVATELSTRGYSLFLFGRRSEPLAETAALCPGESHIVAVDLRDPDACHSAFAQVRTKTVRLDLLVNNAGTNLPSRPLESFSGGELVSVVSSNLISALLCAAEAFAMMKTQLPPGGRIINNGSVAAHAPRPHSAAYTAAKHGVTGLTKSLLLDGRAHGISCCQIDIGNAATERTEKMTQGVPQADGSLAVESRMDLGLVARTIADLANLPPDVSVPFMTIIPTAMPLYGRG